MQDATGRVLGLSAAEIEMSGDSVLKDVVGKITNLTVGGFKHALCDTGFPCKLTLPTIVRGDHLAIAGLKGSERHIFHLTAPATGWSRTSRCGRSEGGQRPPVLPGGSLLARSTGSGP